MLLANVFCILYSSAMRHAGGGATRARRGAARDGAELVQRTEMWRVALAVVAATGQSLLNVILVLGFLDSPVFARVVRSEVLALRSSVFVESAVAAGNPPCEVTRM